MEQNNHSLASSLLVAYLLVGQQQLNGERVGLDQ